jgi:hypothetical protein
MAYASQHLQKPALSSELQTRRSEDLRGGSYFSPLSHNAHPGCRRGFPRPDIPSARLLASLPGRPSQGGHNLALFSDSLGFLWSCDLGLSQLRHGGGVASGARGL